MATETTNYNLVKPATTDFYDVAVQNGNMDIIDANLKTASDSAEQTKADVKNYKIRSLMGVRY